MTESKRLELPSDVTVTLNWCVAAVTFDFGIKSTVKDSVVFVNTLET